jgi:glycosyltransferase 2 family protein
VTERLLRIGRAVLGAAVLLWLGLSLARNWDALRGQPVAWALDPVGIVASVLLVWAMYVMLIAAWRFMLAGWGQRLGAFQAARIWTVSSLGKYVPGKVWAIAGMAMMAREAGVAPWAATASAVLLQALAVGTGAAVTGAAGMRSLEASHPGSRAGVLMLLVASVIAVGVILWPPVARRLVQLVSREPVVSSPAVGPVLFGAGANVLAWIGYGLALWLLARATLPQLTLGPGEAIGAFAASYVAGLVFLLAPGGLGVREGVLVLMLQGSMGWGGATALAIASRLLLTVTEIGAAVPFLILRRESTRDRT